MFRLIISISFLALFAIGCSKDHDNSLRIRNDLPYSADVLRFGDVKFDNLSSYTFSEYIPVEEGTERLTALVFGSNIRSEPITIEGEYTHKWTLTIESTTSVKLTEDN